MKILIFVYIICTVNLKSKFFTKKYKQRYLESSILNYNKGPNKNLTYLAVEELKKAYFRQELKIEKEYLQNKDKKETNKKDLEIKKNDFKKFYINNTEEQLSNCLDKEYDKWKLKLESKNQKLKKILYISIPGFIVLCSILILLIDKVNKKKDDSIN